MLKVNIHHGRLADTTRFNLAAWCEIGYHHLAPVAQYKTLLFEQGFGAIAPHDIANYPRWSSSLWDLAARALALGLHADPDRATETLPALTPPKAGCPFAERVCAVIEHYTPQGQYRNTLGAVEITRVKRLRGSYIARFTEHTMGPVKTAAFDFRPAYFRPAELVAHACAIRLTGEARLPARPPLCIPQRMEVDGVRHVLMHTLVEPARTGFARWLTMFSEPPAVHPLAPMGIAPEVMFLKFLGEAV